MAVSSNSTTVSGSNRNIASQLTDKITGTARMASITYGMIEQALNPSRAISLDDRRGIYTFCFSQDWADEIHFAAADVMDRARGVQALFEALEDEDGNPQLLRRSSEQEGLLSDLDASLSVLAGFAKSINELSGLRNDAEDRLAGIWAMAGPAQDEVERAKKICRKLGTGVAFKEKSTGEKQACGFAN